MQEEAGAANTNNAETFELMPDQGGEAQNDTLGQVDAAATATVPGSFYVSMPVTRKRKNRKEVPTTVELVRRSDRLAGLKAGFKDKPPTDMVIHEEGGPSKNLSQEFEAHVIDPTTPAPPLLPTSLLQAIGSGSCQMTSKMISDEELNYDSADDSADNN